MDDEPKDVADHLIAAARAGSSEGMTKEQFANAASVFWDSWHKAREFMATPVGQSD
ncbi:hypothetical protein [Puniceibacterium antarcticum]|uniref:hypothetical protein n=1 Tax=Puniceibacterium antarcticum TaxID=1206336 RepID=UPI0015D49926|nr:hypothetical protein [Puniceibacterium antarcticum]